MIPPTVGRALQLWYGGSTTIERAVLRHKGKLQLEIYPLCLRISVCDSNGKPRALEREVLFSKTALVSALQAHICRLWRVEVERTRLWNHYSPNLQHQVRLHTHHMKCSCGRSTTTTTTNNKLSAVPPTRMGTGRAGPGSNADRCTAARQPVRGAGNRAGRRLVAPLPVTGRRGGQRFSQFSGGYQQG